MSLSELSRRVVLGTERTPPDLDPAALGHGDAELEALLRQIHERKTPIEGRILDMAAALQAYEQAGLMAPDIEPNPEKVEALLPAEAEPETLPCCSPVAEALLRRVLDSKTVLLGDWLRGAASRGQRAPHVLLPRLLDEGRKKKAWRPYIARVAGRRGRWLAAQRKPWSYLLRTDESVPADESQDPDVGARSRWEEGTRQERKAYLRFHREQDAAAARADLQAVWQEENAGTRADLLSALFVSLTMDDEPFLEDCLDDRSVQVKSAARRLLSFLPESRRAERLMEYAGRHIKVTRKLMKVKLDVEPVAEVDEAMKRDGLTERQSGDVRTGQMGEGAKRLVQLVAACPVRFWTESLGLNPQELAKHLKRHQWKAPLLLGLARAAMRERHADLALALLRGDFGGNPFEVSELLEILPPGPRDKYLMQRIQGHDKDAQFVLTMVEQWTDGETWSPELSSALLAKALELAKKNKKNGKRQLIEFLSRAVYRIPVEQLEAAAKAAPADDELTSYYSNQLSEFTLTADLRQRIQKEFNP